MGTQNTLKAKIICDLHKVFCAEFESGDISLTRIVMNSIIKFHGLKFLEPKEIDTSFSLLDVADIEDCFYDAINCQRCMDLPYFAIQCEAFIDFIQAIRKENEARYGAFAMYHLIVVKKNEAGNEKLRA